MSIPKFPRLDKVTKTSGYLFPGTVVAVFDTLAGETRYVVESSTSPGLLHIFNEAQLELAEAYRIQCGDRVLHRPSDKVWTVCVAVHEYDFIVLWGDRTIFERISDCDVLHRATPEESRKLHASLVGIPRGMADRVYGAVDD